MKFLALILILSLNAFAGNEGGWVSSGGELFKDAHNPWFIKNTDKVYYCIKVDTSTISMPQEDVPHVVESAISFWKNEFQKAYEPETIGRFNLGSQDFILTTCDDNKVDLRFLFGYGTLKAEEIKFLTKPEKYIGVSVRTDYDSVNLKGKGFVYIASDKGEHAYENPGHLIKEAWKNKKLMHFALVHELGHVFGMPHMGSGIMSEVFLDQILNQYLVDSFLKHSADSFLRPKSTLDHCLVSTKIRTQIFKMKETEYCLRMSAAANNTFMLETDAGRPLGKILGLKPDLFDTRNQPASVLQITPAQKVFTQAETGFRSFMFGPTILDMGANATLLINEGNVIYPVYLKITGDSFSIVGKMDNSVIPYVLFQSPLNIILLQSPKP